MSEIITPTPGRIVWYHPAPNDNIPSLYEQPLAAIVACVWNDRRVNLCVIDAYGHDHAVKDVALVQPGDDVMPSGAYAEWMPYQVKTAGITLPVVEAPAPASDTPEAVVDNSKEVQTSNHDEIQGTVPVAQPAEQQVAENNAPVSNVTTEAQL